MLKKALEKEKAHFSDEKVRLEKLKIECAAEPTGVLKAPGDDVLMEDTKEASRDKELALRRMTAAKADANDEKLAAKRVQEMSKLADEISVSRRSGNARKTKR